MGIERIDKNLPKSEAHKFQGSICLKQHMQLLFITIFVNIKWFKFVGFEKTENLETQIEALFLDSNWVSWVLTDSQ